MYMYHIYIHRHIHIHIHIHTNRFAQNEMKKGFFLKNDQFYQINHLTI